MTPTESLLVEAAVEHLARVNGSPIGDRDYALAFLAGLLVGQSPDEPAEADVRAAIDRAVILLKGY